MKIGNLKQIIVYVRDMSLQVKFYRDTLGLKIKYPVQDDYSEVDWVAFDTGECTFALHSGSKGRIGEDAPKFTFEVEDVNLVRDALLTKGVKMGELTSAFPGSNVCAGRDKENNVFYIQNYPKQ